MCIYISVSAALAGEKVEMAGSVLMVKRELSISEIIGVLAKPEDSQKILDGIRQKVEMLKLMRR